VQGDRFEDAHASLAIPKPDGDFVDVATWQFVNRWVFLVHQRSVALTELRALVAQAMARHAVRGDVGA